MAHDHHDRADRLEAYLDGSMTPDESAAFRRELEQDGSLQRELAEARAVEESLKRVFDPPAKTECPTRPPRFLRLSGRMVAGVMAVAAVVFITAVIGIYISGAPTRPSLTAPVVPQWTPDRFYAVFEDEGFEPDWECEDNEHFRTYTKELFGESIEPCQAPFGLQYIGWSYLPSGVRAMTMGTQVLFASYEGENIVVLIDLAEHARELPASENPDLKVFRREVGGLVMYEITPLDEPVAMEALQPECGE